MVHRTRMQDMDAAKQAYQFGRTSFRRDIVRGKTTRNPYLEGTLFHRAFEAGRQHESSLSRSSGADPIPASAKEAFTLEGPGTNP